MAKSRLKYIGVKVDGKKYDLHRLLMQNKLGRELGRKEVVHHVDGNINNNDLSNLKLMSLEEHSSMHSKGRVQTKETIEKLRFISRINRVAAKLTIDDVREIKRLLKLGYQQIQLARRFNVDPATINKLALGKTWSWVA